MHKLGAMHRNLKLEAFSVEIGENSVDIKLTKFNLATFDQESKESVGTLLYQAPEILKGRVYNKKVDVWAIGIFFLVIIC